VNYVNSLTVKVVRDRRICVLTLSGDLDLLAIPGFLMHAAQVVDEPAERFVLDLAGLTFLDCAGARALAAVTSLLPSGCPVIIRSLSPAARQLLDRLNMDLRQEPSAGPEHHDTPERPAQGVLSA
jgi:anti-anti-sigma factor